MDEWRDLGHFGWSQWPRWDDHETMTTNCAPRLILTRYPRHFASKKKQRGTAEGKVHYVTIWRGEEEDVQLCTRTRTRNHNLRLLPPKG